MSDQLKMESGKSGGTVECLGMIFPSEDARRDHFLNLLAEKLKDPAFRAQEGFPIGSDDAILELSDPPYYTACPNPFVETFIRHLGKVEVSDTEYRREPFASDVNEGKNDPIYNAHSYHTKVPPRAIVRYLLNFTSPGDLVFDGFCGTGMTAVAAQLCGDRSVIEALGYRVEPDGRILTPEKADGRTIWREFSKLGPRRAIINDLSPAATFISYNYNRMQRPSYFDETVRPILKAAEKEYSWMYSTLGTSEKPPDFRLI